MLNRLKTLRTSGFDSYRIHRAVALHFSSSYDAVKYNFKVSLKSSTFEAHKHRFFFERVARECPTQDKALEFYVWNVLSGRKWIGEMNDEPVLQKRKYTDSYAYNLQTELKALGNYSFDQLVSVGPNKTEPPIFALVSQGSVSLETLGLINILVDFIPSAVSQISDPLGLFGEKATLALKYQPFLGDIFDLKKFREIIFGFYKDRDM